MVEKNIGVLIASRRKKNNMTQSELAAIVVRKQIMSISNFFCHRENVFFPYVENLGCDIFKFCRSVWVKL